MSITGKVKVLLSVLAWCPWSHVPEKTAFSLVNVAACTLRQKYPAYPSPHTYRNAFVCIHICVYILYTHVLHRFKTEKTFEKHADHLYMHS